MSRFEEPGNFASLLPWKCFSSSQQRADNNRKNGKLHLGWTFVERPTSRCRFYQAKALPRPQSSKTNKVVAIEAIAHKLAARRVSRPADQQPFDRRKCSLEAWSVWSAPPWGWRQNLLALSGGGRAQAGKREVGAMVWRATEVWDRAITGEPLLANSLYGHAPYDRFVLGRLVRQGAYSSVISRSAALILMVTGADRRVRRHGAETPGLPNHRRP